MRRQDSVPVAEETPLPTGDSGARRRTNVTLALVLAAVGCGVDLWTKAKVFGWLGDPSPMAENIWWIWPEYVGLQTSINTGALFGLGQGQVVWFAVISLGAILAVVWWLVFGAAGWDRGLSAIVGLILGGILGNLYDRMGFWGQAGVRDWILLQYRGFVWPNFNIADSLLVCGAALLVWHAYRQETAQPPASDASASAAPAPATRPARSPAQSGSQQATRQQP